MPCDELLEDLRCAHCGSVPASYTSNGREFCWLHREPLSETYPISANFLFTVYSWRGHESDFPNAKLYEANSGEQTDGVSQFCRTCQAAFERWFGQERLNGKVAER